MIISSKAEASGTKGDNNMANTSVMVRTSQGGYIRKNVVSVKEMKFKNIVPQKYDFSCGAASLATVFKYVYGIEEMVEEKIAREMIERGDQEKIKEKGFSLLDMKKYAEAQGFQANGYKVKAENLNKLKIPVIILITTRGYKHFVVLKGIKDGRAYLADPALGNRSIPVDQFIESWDGVIFLVYKKTDQPIHLSMDGELKAPRGSVLGILGVGLRYYTPLPGEF
jgi:predicted double-glycine peptidase